MPLTHISLLAGKSDTYRQAVIDGVCRALHETFDVPEDNQFMTMTEHTAANFRFDASYLGIARSENLVFIQITANATRTVAQKKALYKRIAELLADRPQSSCVGVLAAAARRHAGARSGDAYALSDRDIPTIGVPYRRHR